MTSPAPAKRRARTPSLLRVSQAVLVAGAVFAAAAALGPIWVVRAGIVLALAAGVLAVVFAVRQVTAERRRSAALTLQQSRAHGSALTDERRRNAEVVELLTERANDRAAELDKQRGQNHRLGARIAELTSSTASLRSEITARDNTISGLRDSLHARDAELEILRAEVDADRLAADANADANANANANADAEVQALPRHRRPEAGTRTTDESVIDLPAVEKVLPNFEVEHRKHA